MCPRSVIQIILYWVAILYVRIHRLTDVEVNDGARSFQGTSPQATAQVMDQMLSQSIS